MLPCSTRGSGKLRVPDGTILNCHHSVRENRKTQINCPFRLERFHYSQCPPRPPVQASSPDELVAGKPAHQPLQLQDAERGQDLSGSQAGASDQLVDADGMVVELAEQGSLLVAEAKLGRVADGGLVRGGVHLANQRAKLLEDVVDRLDQAGAVTDQAVAAAAGQAVHRAGHGEDLPVLFFTLCRCQPIPMAWCAVDSDPLRATASTTMTP